MKTSNSPRNAVQKFNVTKNKAIDLSNKQIQKIKGLGRQKVAQMLNLNESQARKVLNAVKEGIIKEKSVTSIAVYLLTNLVQRFVAINKFTPTYSNNLKF